MTTRAVLYTRVSTEEQVESGYSLGGQSRKLREFAASEGWRVVEVIEDDGYSGADPYRPGLRRALELAEAGELDVVLAAKRDRLFRSRLYRLTFERDLKDLGVRLVALNDVGHRIGDGVMDDFAEWEREQITERLQGGIRDMIVGGEIKAGPKAPYGFRYSATGKKALLVNAPEMAVVVRVIRETAQGTSAGALRDALEDEGVPSPSGLPRWSKKTLAHFLGNDLYRPHGAAEVAAMVSPEVAARLDEGRLYGLWYWNRRKTRHWKEWDGREYRDRYSSERRPRSEWLCVPVDVTDAGLSRAVVDYAREAAKDRYRKPSGAAGRFWQLRGIVRCAECGSVLSPQTVSRTRADGSKARRFYHQCRRRYNNGPRNCDHTRSYPAPAMEEAVWQAVYGLLSDPESLRREHRLWVECMRRELAGDPERETRKLSAGLAKLDLRRSGYLDLAADGDMGREELRAKLADLKEQRGGLEEALRAARNRSQSIEGVERAWAAVEIITQLDRITFLVASPEDRRRLYGALALRADVDKGGTVTITGRFDPEIRLLDVLRDGPDMTTPVPKVPEGMRVVVASGDTHSRRRRSRECRP